MRTTLDLPDPLFRDLKAMAAQKGMKMKELVASYVQTGLYASQGPEGSIKQSPLPAPRKASGKKMPALSNAQIQELLDDEDATH